MGIEETIDITLSQRKTVLALIRQYLPGVAVWAYGSRVKWTSRPQSDLDLVVFASPEQKDRVGDLREAFEESDLSFRVDLFVWDEVPKSFREQIEREHVALLDKHEPYFGGKMPKAKRVWEDMPFTEAFLVNPPVNLERGQDYPFVDMAALTPGFRTVHSSEERKFRGGGSKFQGGDTLMARITPCLENGKVAQYCAKSLAEKVAHGSTEFIVVRGRPDITCSEFAYYVSQSEVVRDYAVGQMTGTSGRQRVPTTSLEHLMIPVPTLQEQHAIADVLGTFDDKIELNQRMNETLEEMARALFKSWFVDFDPVRAKMENRDTGLPKHVADLFPDRLVESELGEIPEGWSIRNLAETFDLEMGQSPPGNTYNKHAEGLPFFQGRSDFGFRFPQNRKFCTSPKRTAQPEDTLISVRAPVGDMNMAWERCCIGRGVAALRHKSGSASFTYYSARAVQKQIRRYEHTGTVFGSINKQQFEALRILEPTVEVINAFDSQVNTLDKRIRNGTSEIHLLSFLRDTLLPRLISGEIQAKGAECLGTTT